MTTANPRMALHPAHGHVMTAIMMLVGAALREGPATAETVYLKNLVQAANEYEKRKLGRKEEETSDE